ncbi:hypothetical protein [Thalassotalea agariperforans]
MIKLKSILIILVSTLFYSGMALSAEKLVVVVNANNPVNSLTKSEVIDIFMGKYLAYPNGDLANPIELNDDNLLKESFYQNLIGRSVASVNAYWARLKFTGRKRKASVLDSEDDVIEQLDGAKFAIGYIRESKLTNNLKVVYRFNE